MLLDSKNVDIYRYIPKNNILNMVASITESKVKLSIGFKVEKEWNQGLDEIDDESLVCLEIRRRYGGMKGDMNMIKEAGNIYVDGVGEEVKEVVERVNPYYYHNNYNNRNWSLISSLVYPSPDFTFTKLTTSIIQSTGIDFHCSNIINDVIEVRAKNVMEGVYAVLGIKDKEEVQEEVRRSMWENCGRVNEREVVGGGWVGEGDEKRKVVWGILKPFFEGWRKDYCRERCCT
ncbi:hypothetical protein TL16_g09040 [Triparma laevis f. inornata]|uniref:Uncharacterized protein n=1 Tax=Triparma laevis f. inornata TaxID=1714386 RepID=A0A9W7B0X6_9STRA|nr:hypothetical protein TL16_g09040 [Triparma laevis f. inornata]